jgi:Palmitoyl protein thioesterase
MRISRAGSRNLTKGGLAIAAALLALWLVPASAAAKDVNRPLIFVHGHEADSGVSCNSTWKDMMAHFRIYGYKGPFYPIEYYKNDTACNTYYGSGKSLRISSATSDTPIQQIAKDLAWHVYYINVATGQGVNVVAHSMGGLVVRYMIDQVQRHKAGWPPNITVPSVVTLGTPHNGIDFADPFGCRLTGDSDECRQMDSSSSFIRYLRDNARNPQSAFGTWWSLGGSHADNTVDEGSATDMSVKYKMHWASDTSIEHSDYMHEKLGANPFNSSSITAHCFSTSTGGSFVEGHCYWPIQWAYVILAYYGY